MTLGKMLKYARENADLTQKAVKEKTNINNKTLSNWEHDISNPAPNDLKVLAKLYNVTVGRQYCLRIRLVGFALLCVLLLVTML